MRPTRVRCSVRRLMAGVAVVAACMGAGHWGREMLRRSERYEELAVEYGFLELLYRNGTVRYCSPPPFGPRDQVAYSRRMGS